MKEQRPVAKIAAVASVKAATQKISLASRRVSAGDSLRGVAELRGDVVVTAASVRSAEQSVTTWERDFVAQVMRAVKREARNEAVVDAERGRFGEPGW